MKDKSKKKYNMKKKILIRPLQLSRVYLDKAMSCFYLLDRFIDKNTASDEFCEDLVDSLNKVINYLSKIEEQEIFDNKGLEIKDLYKIIGEPRSDKE